MDAYAKLGSQFQVNWKQETTVSVISDSSSEIRNFDIDRSCKVYQGVLDAGSP
jgi:hypothetical protein